MLGFAVRTLAILVYMPTSSRSPALYWGPLVFTLAVYAALSAGVWAGYRWVKILLVVSVVWQAVVYLPKLSSNPPGASVLGLLALGLEVLAAVIILKDLFTPTPAPK